MPDGPDRLGRTISLLRRQSQKLGRAIQILQNVSAVLKKTEGARLALQRQGKAGRRSMSEAERLLVAERMRRYWVKRKREKSAGM